MIWSNQFHYKSKLYLNQWMTEWTILLIWINLILLLNNNDALCFDLCFALINLMYCHHLSYLFLFSFNRYSTELHDILPNCDYLLSVLPSTTNTIGLLNGEKLKLCAIKVIIINWLTDKHFKHLHLISNWIIWILESWAYLFMVYYII